MLEPAKLDELTSTFGLGPQRRSRGAGAALQRPGQQHADFVLGVGIQVADFVRGLVDGLKVVHGARHGAVFHLPFNNGAVPVNAVGVELNPQVGGADSSQLRRCNGHRRLCGRCGKLG